MTPLLRRILLAVLVVAALPIVLLALFLGWIFLMVGESGEDEC